MRGKKEKKKFVPEPPICLISRCLCIFHTSFQVVLSANSHKRNPFSLLEPKKMSVVDEGKRRSGARLGVLAYTLIPRPTTATAAVEDNTHVHVRAAKQVAFMLWKNSKATVLQSAAFWGELVCEKVCSYFFYYISSNRSI